MMLQRFLVKGFGTFPIDMLRYDQAFPLRETESAKIIYGERGVEIELGRHVEDESDEPCYGRWQSFGWKVVPGSVRTI
jgi:hypothetical protein